MAESGSTQPPGAAEGSPTSIDYRRFAGRALFPRSPEELTDASRCPACYTTLEGPLCRVCRLDVSHPAAAEVATLSRDAASLLDRRLEVIGRIRWDTAQADSAAAATAAHDYREAATGAAHSTSTVFVPLTPVTPASAASVPRPEAISPVVPIAPTITGVTPPRRSSVQVILLIVGISLLSVAAIFFLVYAFINFGILGRSLIIAAVTIASFVIASMLRRRSLTATAEGIAVLAVVLVYLDAFAIRANDFFGLGAVNGAAFWGAALLVTAVGFLAWHRLSGLRTPNIVGFGAAVPGVALLVGGANDSADGGSRVFLAFAAAALAGVAYRFVSRPATGTRQAFDGAPERLVVLVLTGVALFGAFGLAATVAPGQPWASAAGFLVVAGLAALHAWQVGSVARLSIADFAPVFAPVFAALGGAAAAVSVASGALRLGDLDTIVITPPVAATFVALALELAWRRMSGTTSRALSYRRSTLVASIAAGTVAAVAIVFPFALAMKSTATTIFRALSSSWTLAPGETLTRAETTVWMAVAALALSGLMMTLAWALGGTLARRRVIPLWFGALVLVMAVPLLSTVGAVTAGWLVLAVAALGTLLWMRTRSVARHLRAPVLALLAVAGAFAYLAGWASTATWWIGSLVAVALLLASRLHTSSSLGRSTALGVVAMVVLIGGAAGARQLALPANPDSASDLGNALRAVSIVAVVLLTLSAFRVHAGLSVLDRRVLFWISAASAAVSFVTLALMIGSAAPGGRISLLLPEPGTSLAADAALLAALVTVVTRPLASRLPRERVVASVALAPTLTLVIDQFARVVGLPELERSVGSISAALLSSVGVLAVASVHARRPVPPENEPPRGILGNDRLPREFGILLVAVPSVVVGVFRHDSVTWLVLVLAALVALAIATSPDGLVRSSSPRRYLGWGALALATSGLWWRLGDARVVEFEPYVLPLAGVLLLVALMVWRANRSAATSTPDLVAPVITLAALLVAILPLAGAASTGPLLRAVVLVTVSAALVIVGSTLIGKPRSRPYLDSMALAGALGVLTVVIGRSAFLGSRSDAPDIRLDAWLATGLLVLLIAAFGQARDRGDHSATWRVFTGQVLAVLGLLMVLGFEVSAFEATALGSLRASAVILLFSAVHVICFLVDRGPLTPLIGWIAISGAAVAVLAGLITGALAPVELGTVPVAAALAVTGALTLSQVPTARTWPWLAPATAVLLIPSLLATADNPPVWRLVALGVVGVAIIITSAILRLQAPFLIAVVVVLIHAIATFAPQIRVIYESVEWWLWFVPVGIAVVVFAARFEKSVLRMRSVAMRIRALR